MSALTRHHLDTPVGKLTIELSGGALTMLDFGAHGKATPGTPSSGLAAEIGRQIEAYFSGELKQFDLPLCATGTPFRQKVWQALRAVPYGQTRSYGEIAREVDSAPRAVGGACGANPIAIVVPCHRIVGAGGWIGGFSGGEGCATKHILLELEAAQQRLGV
ncbi:MAG: methylated-DNA--[protein]-cysteine S-methyltransferase [Alphaproteobacteria bacterium]|jgi:methylated-DNA-[protein]-cysteine S-methyltransferase|nr:methylated-DNA--[protein]-cysteine S-methyltransferase [Alphaproteobacteria bacterium]MDP6590599.1 methylated-DNA--[protein]-cysteine S-methyltransferase [Alphaproteobacteria bacterium]MDP6819168.1 methylated-DNA--[protein]-cysteine S-methyltransferase [Alphaproteobacteria bacterium]|tara:strand:+ start:2114 stop:2596 length:483 start_codon:yes stop_codon:yes gene_type:complete